MIVTGIEMITKKKCKVELDGQLAFVLYKGELVRYCLRVGGEVASEQYDEVVNEVLLKRAKKYLLHLLTKMDRTSYELRIKLHRAYYPDEVIEKAVAYVASFGYVDDSSYAKRYLRAHERRLSYRQIKRKLATKGISKNILDALDDIKRQDEGGLIEAHICKKTKGRVNLDDKEIKQIAAYLFRKGFESSDIWQYLKKCRNNKDDYFEWYS